MHRFGLGLWSAIRMKVLQQENNNNKKSIVYKIL
jgi:hypothetical protein